MSKVEDRILRLIPVWCDIVERLCCQVKFGCSVDRLQLTTGVLVADRKWWSQLSSAQQYRLPLTDTIRSMGWWFMCGLWRSGAAPGLRTESRLWLILLSYAPRSRGTAISIPIGPKFPPRLRLLTGERLCCRYVIHFQIPFLIFLTLIIVPKLILVMILLQEMLVIYKHCKFGQFFDF